MMLPQEYLNECFAYDMQTGVLTWSARPAYHFADQSYCDRWNARFPGKPAGKVNKVGYVRVVVANKQLLAHRVIWTMLYGDSPEQIDHLNGDKTDNRLVNIEGGSSKENMRNQRRHSNNTSGICGVSWDKTRGLWHAYIGIGECRRRSIGMFDRKQDAISARRAAERELGYKPNHGKPAGDMSSKHSFCLYVPDRSY